MAVDAELSDGAQAAPKKSPKTMLIIAAIALAVALAGAGSYLFIFAAKPAALEDGMAVAPPESFIFNLPPMMVNLNSPSGAQEFMKLTVALEVASEQTMLDIQPRMAKVIDAFQVYLRELRKSDLEGSAGIYRLKEELRRRVNIAVYPAVVESILFKEILVQ